MKKEFKSEKVKGKAHLEDSGTEGRTILKWILTK
jgi:hypothetical protein